MQDGWFISGNNISTEYGACRTNSTIYSNDNRDFGIHNITNSCYRGLRQFFIKPDLFIEIFEKYDNDTFRPESSGPEQNVIRKRLKVRIVNRGKGIATDCSAKFRITRSPKTTRTPSTDSKTLMWNDGLATRSIYPRGEEEMLHVVFADSDMQHIAATTNTDIFALIATPDAYNNRLSRAQDGFGAGDFEAELTVKSKEGGYCKAILFVHLDHDYRKIRLGYSQWDRIIAIYKRRPSLFGVISELLRNIIR